MESLDSKEMLIRLMDKIDDLKSEQIEHHTFAKAKLESIETQAVKTNGRVTANENEITGIKKDVAGAKTVFYTLSSVLSIVWAVITFLFK